MNNFCLFFSFFSKVWLMHLFAYIRVYVPVLKAVAGVSEAFIFDDLKQRNK